MNKLIERNYNLLLPDEEQKDTKPKLQCGLPQGILRKKSCWRISFVIPRLNRGSLNRGSTVVATWQIALVYSKKVRKDMIILAGFN